MFLEYQEPLVVPFKGKFFVVWREDEEKGSDYLAVELPTMVASKALVDAYFDIKYPPLGEQS